MGTFSRTRFSCLQGSGRPLLGDGVPPDDDQRGSRVNADLIVLVTEGDRAIESRQRSGDSWRVVPAVDASAARELARLAQGTGGWIAWFDRRIEPRLTNVTTWPGLLRHDLEVLHAGFVDRPDLAAASLGYVDFDSLHFFAPAPEHRSPMWFVSAAAGIARATALRAIGIDPSFARFSAALIDFGGRGVRVGLCAYSDPRLLAPPARAEDTALRAHLASSDLALLVRRFYGRQWVLFWLASLLLFARSFPVWATVRAWLQPAAAPIDKTALAPLAPSLQKGDSTAGVHAIVPTLGRPHSIEHLLDDLARQTHGLCSVAIVEQQPNGGGSALTPLVSKPWPFKIEHRVVTWTGACRARNDGLESATGNWILFLDADVRVPSRFVENALSVARTYGAEAVTALVRSPDSHQPGPDNSRPHFTSVFPTCAALVSQSAANAVGPFDLRLEGGWGEDFEYGLRLRKAGGTMVRTPGEPILHLHEPSGGFRSPLRHPWDLDKISPRPSPTVLLSRRGLPLPMQQGHRLYYVIKRLAGVPWYRAIGELTTAKRQWRAAATWANRLAETQVPRAGH